jgi:hypothetical protein
MFGDDNSSILQTMASARSFKYYLEGETLDEQAQRLFALDKPQGYSDTVMIAQQWRQRFKSSLVEAALQTSDPRIAEIPRTIIRGLDDGIRFDAVDGGIDFDSSHMLINQKGEADFSQISSKSPAAWQHINGLKPIFLRLVPVNLSQLLGTI